MTDEDTPKALHDAVYRQIGGAQKCDDILALARAVRHLGAPEDLAGSLRSVIHGKATGNQSMDGTLGASDLAALVEAYDLVKPQPEPLIRRGAGF